MKKRILRLFPVLALCLLLLPFSAWAEGSASIVDGRLIISGTTDGTDLPAGEYTNIEITSTGVVTGGTYTVDVDNEGAIEGGVFTGDVMNRSTSGQIKGGTFATVYNFSSMTGGTVDDLSNVNASVTGVTVTNSISNSNTICNNMTLLFDDPSKIKEDGMSATYVVMTVNGADKPCPVGQKADEWLRTFVEDPPSVDPQGWYRLVDGTFVKLTDTDVFPTKKTVYTSLIGKSFGLSGFTEDIHGDYIAWPGDTIGVFNRDAQWYVGDTLVESTVSMPRRVYTVQADDVGKNAVAKLTDGYATAESSPIRIVGDLEVSVPDAVMPGTEIQPEFNWQLKASAMTYQWNRNGTAIDGAASATYTPVDADLGSTLTLVVSYKNTTYTTDPVTVGLVDYDVTVNNVAVTSANKYDVLGDGTVRYDAKNNLLTVTTESPSSFTIAGNGSTDVEIGSSTTNPLASGLTVTKAKNVTVTANSSSPTIASGTVTIACSGDVLIENKGTGQALVNNLTVTAAENVTVTANSSNPTIASGKVNIACSGDVLIENKGTGNALVVSAVFSGAHKVTLSAANRASTDPITYTPPSGKLYTVKAGASLSALADKASGWIDESYGPETLTDPVIVIEAGVHTHTLTPVEAVAPTCTEDGNIEHFKCTHPRCGKLFADAEGTNELTAEDVTLDAPGHTPGVWDHDDDEHWRFCTVCSVELDRSEHVFDGRTCIYCGHVESSSDGSPASSIRVETPKHGGLTVSPKRASKGDTVTITVEPDKGYVLDELTVTDRNGDEIAVKDKGDGRFTFKMPAGKVEVEATFVPEPAQNRTIVLTLGSNIATVFGNPVVNDVAPVARNNRTLLPIRFVAEALGASVDWNADLQKVTIAKPDLLIEITLGSNTAYVNGKAVELDVAAFAENNRTYLPLRFVAEHLGATVLWDAPTQSITIIA